MGVCLDPPCVVTEFMERGTLFATLHDDTLPLPFSRRVRFASEIAGGMLFLHRGGFVHRDLKSLNVLLNSDWRCKVSDLGQATGVQGGGLF